MDGSARGKPKHTRREILGLLCVSYRTARELAGELEISATAVRAHLDRLEEDGLVRHEVVRKGVGKPTHRYELTPDGEATVSRAYLPLLHGVLAVLESERSAATVERVVQSAGRAVAADRARAQTARRPAELALDLLGGLGGMGFVEESDGKVVIRSRCCPIGSIVTEHPVACKAMEAMLQEALNLPVSASCTYGPRPSCRFTIESAQ